MHNLVVNAAQILPPHSIYFFFDLLERFEKKDEARSIAFLTGFTP